MKVYSKMSTSTFCFREIVTTNKRDDIDLYRDVCCIIAADKINKSYPNQDQIQDGISKPIELPSKVDQAYIVIREEMIQEICPQEFLMYIMVRNIQNMLNLQSKFFDKTGYIIRPQSWAEHDRLLMQDLLDRERIQSINKSIFIFENYHEKNLDLKNIGLIVKILKK